MAITKFAALILLMLLAGLIMAEAEERFGVTIYANATYDAAISKILSEVLKTDAACYRTNEKLSKVVEFYKKQSGLEFLPADSNNAMFKKGKIDITIQDKWADMKTGKMMSDTLITILKNR